MLNNLGGQRIELLLVGHTCDLGSDSYNLELSKRRAEAVKQALLANLGYSIMPLIGIKNELQNNDLKIIPYKGLPIETQWSLIWLKGKKHSNVAIAFLEYLKEVKKGILTNIFKWYEDY